MCRTVHDYRATGAQRIDISAIQLLVAGQGNVEDILDPATGKVIARVAEASNEQIDAAVRAAETAFGGWSQTAPKDRAALLLKLADRIEDDQGGSVGAVERRRDRAVECSLDASHGP